jgi:hypothetical protein
MIVEIPVKPHHEGNAVNLRRIEISDVCPKCGSRRGVKRWRGLSYDGNKRLVVDCWLNECDHRDKYSDIWEEYNSSVCNG